MTTKECVAICEELYNHTGLDTPVKWEKKLQVRLVGVLGNCGNVHVNKRAAGGANAKGDHQHRASYTSPIW